MTHPNPPVEPTPGQPAGAPPLVTMPLVEHLRELRTRLMWSVGAVIAGMAVSLVITRDVIEGLKGMCEACDFQAIDPLEIFTTYFRVALVLGLVLGTPVILYQIAMYIMPALHKHEKRYLLLLLPGASVLFIVGLVFGFELVLPRTIGFLATFLAQGDSMVAEPTYRIGNYVAFMTNLLFLIGAAFQTPLVVYLFAKLGIVTPAFLARYRKHAILVLAVLAAVMTPTPDPFTMLMVLTPMVVLYEVGILLARFA